MVGPERYHHLRFGAWIFQWSENTRSERIRIVAVQLPFRINREALPILVYLLYLSSKPLHRESWVQRHRNGFESRTARVNLKEDMDEETSAEEKERQRKALQSFAKEFGRGVRQQRTRVKTKERAGTLPLALSMFRRNASAYGEVDLLKGVQCKGSEWRTNCSSRRIQRIWDYLFKRRLSCSQAQLQEVYHPFFLAVLLKDLHHNGDAFLEDHTGLRWLEQSEEDRLVYQTGHRDDRNSRKCIIGKVQIIKDGNNFCLCCLEE